jgi:hypothetical protein
MQRTVPAVQFVVVASRPCAGPAVDRHFVMPLQPLEYQTPQTSDAGLLARWKSKVNRKHVAAIAILYLVTWIGGGLTYSRNLSARAWSMSRAGIARDAQEAAWYKAQGIPNPRTIPRTSATPTSRVNWCVPLLPGVLLADSEYHIGPLWAAGGPTLVVYYGFGTFELRIGGWRA